MKKVNLPLPSGLQDSPQVGTQSLRNLYAVPRVGESLSNGFSVRAHAGLRPFTTTGNGPVRAIFTHKGTLYTINGDALYSVDDNGIVTEIREIAGEGHCSVACGEDHCLIATTSRTYVLDSSGSAVIGVELPATRWNLLSVSWMDGRFIAARPRGVLELSDLDNPYNWQGLGFVTAESYNDEVVSLLRDVQDLWVFGESTVEWWRSAGGDVPTMDRVGWVNIGCASRDCASVYDSVVYWLDADGIVRASKGYEPQKISTSFIDDALYKLDVTTAESFIYIDRNNPIYTLTVEGRTFCYSINSGTWSERTGYLRAWIADGVTTVNSKPYTGSREDGQIYRIDPDFYMDGNEMIVKECTFPAASFNDDRVRYDSFRVRAATGLTFDANRAPEIIMDYSDDGGNTWSSERILPYGRSGEYGGLLVWRRLGRSRQRVFRGAVADDVPVELTAAYAEVTALK